MKTCPTLHMPAAIEPGFIRSPIVLPYARSLISCLGRFNDPKRAGYNPNYQWGMNDQQCGHNGNDLGPIPTGDRGLYAMVDGVVGSVNLVDTWDDIKKTGDAAGVWLSIHTQCPEAAHWFNFRTLHVVTGSILVKVGDVVKQGQRLATVGTTGSAHWLHSHVDVQHSTNPNANLVPASYTRNRWFGPSWGEPYDPQAWGIISLPPIVNPIPPEEEIMLKPGSAGAAVKYYQLQLLKWDPACLPKWGADGEYGSETSAAVSKFQTERNLTATGNIDGITADLLSTY